MSEQATTSRSKHFYFRIFGLLACLSMAWISYAVDRAMLWALLGATAFALGLLLGDEQ